MTSMLRHVTSAALVLTAMLATSAARAQDPRELVFAFQKQADPAKIQTNADKVAEFLGEELGVPVKAVVPMDYGATVQAMVVGKADIAYFDSIPFLLARRDTDARLLLAELRTDAQGKARTSYDSIFVVAKDSPLRSMDDLVKHAKDLRVAFTSPTSTSGYVMAYSRFVDEGLLKPRQDVRTAFKSVAFGGSYTGALRAVLDGRADVAAVSNYTMEGAKADVYLPSAEREKLRILARTPKVPTHVIAARGALSEPLRAKITTALLKLSKEKPDLLADVYGAAEFTKVDEKKHAAATAEALERLGVTVDEFVKK